LKHRYFWGAFAASLAFLTWQPLLVYAIVAIGVAALATAPGTRGRNVAVALGGVAIPIVATAVYLLAVGAFDDMVDALFIFPTTDLKRTSMSVTHRVSRISAIANRWYGGVFFWT